MGQRYERLVANEVEPIQVDLRELVHPGDRAVILAGTIELAQGTQRFEARRVLIAEIVYDRAIVTATELQSGGGRSAGAAVCVGANRVSDIVVSVRPWLRALG